MSTSFLCDICTRIQCSFACHINTKTLSSCTHTHTTHTDILSFDPFVFHAPVCIIFFRLLSRSLPQRLTGANSFFFLIFKKLISRPIAKKRVKWERKGRMRDGQMEGNNRRRVGEWKRWRVLIHSPGGMSYLISSLLLGSNKNY